MRESIAHSDARLTPAPALPPHFMPSPHAPPELETEYYPAPQTSGYKRSREEASTDDERDLEGPPKPHKAQVVPHQPITRSINRPKTPLGLLHRQVECRVGDMASRNKFPDTPNTTTHSYLTGHTVQAEPYNIQHVEGNRFDAPTANNLEESETQTAALEIRLDESLGIWLAEQRKSNKDHFSLTDLASPAAEDYVSQPPAEMLNTSLPSDNAGFENSTSSISLILAGIWSLPPVPETEDDLFAQFLDEDS